MLDLFKPKALERTGKAELRIRITTQLPMTLVIGVSRSFGRIRRNNGNV